MSLGAGGQFLIQLEDGLDIAVVRFRAASFGAATGEIVFNRRAQGFGIGRRNQLNVRWAHAVVGGDHGGPEAEGFADGNGIAIIEAGPQEEVALGDGTQGQGVWEIAPEEDMVRIGLALDVSTQGGFETSGAGDEETGFGVAVANASEDIDLHSQVVLRLQESHSQQEGGVRVDELFQSFRVGNLLGRSHAVGMDEANAIGRNTETVEELLQLGIHGDDPVEALKDETAECVWARGEPFRRLGVAPGVKREHSLAAGHQAAEQGQRQQPKAWEATDVEMQDVVAQAEQEAKHGQGTLRIVDVVSVWPTKAREIDHCAGMSAFAQVSADGNQIGLHATMRRRVGAELQNSHWRTASRSMARGSRARADSSMRRQPMVARAPSRTVMAGALPSRMFLRKASSWAR